MVPNRAKHYVNPGDDLYLFAVRVVKSLLLYNSPSCFSYNYYCDLFCYFFLSLITFFISQAKLAARKARRNQDAKRQGQEEATQRILDEQAKLAVQSKPTGVEYINIPNVVAGQSAEEQVEQKRFTDQNIYQFLSLYQTIFDQTQLAFTCSK